MRVFLLSVAFLAVTSVAHAQEFNAGIVQGLWYDKDIFFEGDTVRVYVAVRNNTGADLTGRVEFYDGEMLIERNNISALDGRIIESWADWEPEYGEHTITATLSRIELQQVGSSSQAVEVTSALAESTIFVDRDTDGDDIGDKEDTDDDNDGISDEKEEEKGTDPLDPDSPAPVSDEESEVGDPEADSNTDKDGSPSSQSESNGSNSSRDSEGLEQFLTESRADSALTSVTNIVNNTKRRLDSYREARNARIQGESTSIEDVAEESHLPAQAGSDSSAASDTPTTTDDTATTSEDAETETDTDGFGEVTRSQAEKGPGFFSTVASLAKALVSNVYTLILFLFSLYLSHPIIVQLTLLALILFLIYKIARRIGRRPT